MLLPALAPDRARQIVAAARGLRVLVVGDVMIDRFIVGRVTRISPEAPVPVVTFDHETTRLGGAANVAANVAAIGGEPTLVGLTGRDETAATLTEACRAAGITPALVTDADRQTTTKVRIVTDRNQQVARIDYESDEELSAAIEARVTNEIRAHGGQVHAVVISDYLKGMVSRGVVQAVVDAAGGRGIPVIVDPKIPHLAHYRGVGLVTPNHVEAEVATHRRIRTHDEAREAAALFRERTGCREVLITRGDQGMWLLADGLEGSLPAVAREVADVTGAGDTVVATLALSLAAGASTAEAARLANQAAGIVVGKFGPATTSADELLASLAP